MKILFFILGSLLTVSSFSQNGEKLSYKFHHLTSADGFTGNHVADIVQDNAGYIWIYTLNRGLQRYDGVRFQDFGDQFFNKSSNSSVIQRLFAYKGNLFVLAKNIYFIYDDIRQRFDTFHFQDTSPKLTFWAPNGDKWSVGANSVLVTERSGKLKLKREFLNEKIGVRSDLLYDSIGHQYWLHDDGKLFVMDVASQKVYAQTDDAHIPLFSILKSKTYPGVSNVIIDRSNNLWVSTWEGGFWKYDLKTKQVTQYFLKKILEKDGKILGINPLGINGFFIDDHNQLWATVYGAGLLKYNKEKDNFSYAIIDRADPQSIQYNYETKAITQDRQGNIWIGSDKGVSIFNPYYDYFDMLRHEPGNPRSLPVNEIERAFQTSANELWVATWGGGITVYDSLLSYSRNYKFDKEEANMVWCFAEDKNRRVWIGCQGGWVTRYDPLTRVFEKPFHINNLISTVISMTSDRSGNIYFGYNSGSIAKWDAIRDTFVILKQNTSWGKRVSRIQFMREDARGNIWVATGAKLYKLDTKRMHYTDSVQLVSKNAIPEYSDFLSTFFIMNDSIFLINSLNGKPGYLNVYTKEFRELLIPDDIVRERIASLSIDKSGSIWFTSGTKLYQLIASTRTRLINYIIDDGRVSSHFRQYEILPLSSGRWAIWTGSEICVFNPLQLAEGAEERVKNPIVVTGFRLFGRYQKIDSALKAGDPLVLRHDQNFFTIEFSPLSFSSVSNQKYYYKLSGINQDWVAADKSYSASYTNVKPGEYVFSLRPEGEDAADKVVSFEIIIKPPFYHTWWFYTLSSMTVALFITLLIRRRIKMVRREGELKQKVVETETAALRAQMNPHFIFNCLSAIDNLIQSGDRDEATTYLARFAKLIRNVLDSSKNNTIAFYKDFETIKLFLEMEQFRKGNKFAYELHADSELINGDYKVPPMLLQPFIENAIHHGLANKLEGRKLLTVEARLQKDSICYTVTDSGVGRGRAAELKRINNPQHVSYGIDISKQRISTYNNIGQSENEKFDEDSLKIIDLEDDRGNPCGTQVEIRLNIYS